MPNDLAAMKWPNSCTVMRKARPEDGDHPHPLAEHQSGQHRAAEQQGPGAQGARRRVRLGRRSCRRVSASERRAVLCHVVSHVVTRYPFEVTSTLAAAGRRRVHSERPASASPATRRASPSTAYTSSSDVTAESPSRSRLRLDDLGDAQERQPPLEEGGDGDLVGGVQHDGRGDRTRARARGRGFALGQHGLGARLLGERQAAERRRVRPLEGDRSGEQVEPPYLRQRRPLGYASA